MKTYFVNYSMLGGGVLEIVANSAREADSIAMDVSMEILMRTTDFGGGFSIDHIDDEHGNEVDVDVEEEEEQEEFGYIVIS